MAFYEVRSGVGVGAITVGSQRKLARDSNGRLWVAWYETVAGDIHIWVAYSDDEGATWTPEDITPALAAQQTHPSLAIDSANNLHVVWDGRGWGVNVGTFGIQYRQRSAAGVWSAVELIADNVRNQYYPSIAIDSLDRPHVAFQGQGYMPLVLQWSLVYHTRVGGVWSAALVIEQSAGLSGFPSIAVDSGDDIHLVWAGGWGSDIQYNRRTGGVWGVQEAVTNVPGNQEVPSLALDSSGAPHVTWTGKTWGLNPAIRNIRYRNRVGGAWGAHEAVTDEANEQRWANISINGVDSVFATWLGLGFGTFPARRQVMLRRRTAGGWDANQQLTDINLAQGADPNLMWPGAPYSGCEMVYNEATPPYRVMYGWPAAYPPAPPPAPPAAPPYRHNQAFALSREEL